MYGNNALPPKPKYLTNKEILIEIHKSKTSYSSYTKPEYANYDVIVQSLDHITPELVEGVLKTRSSKTNVPISENPDLVIRVMSSAHIPADTTGKRRPKTPGGIAATKTCFSPYSHYLWHNGILTEVGRSHWVGSLENGHFSNEHGKISPRLARMFMLLVDRYSRRGNWRGYCIDESTEAFTKRGWLSHDNITEQDTILSYRDGSLCWSSISSIFKDNFNGKMFRLVGNGIDALVTPGHKFVTKRGLKRVDHILDDDIVILNGSKLVSNDYEQITDTEINESLKSNTPLPNDKILQLTEQQKINLLKGLIEDPFYSLGNICWYLAKNDEMKDMFVFLCTILGLRTTTSYTWKDRILVTSMSDNTIKSTNIDFHGGYRNSEGDEISNPHQPTYDYNGVVWCPKTEYGNFMARRNGVVYLTGNTYVDEMRSFALLQLSQVGLQFDEAVSDNPFAFYTRIMLNCFRRVLLLEKRNQTIRDELLIMSGVAPSFARQIDNEMEQRNEDAVIKTTSISPPTVIEPPKKRGRKPKVVSEA